MKPLWETEEARRQSFRNVFGTGEGIKVLEALKRTTGFYRPIFDPNPHIAAFNEGQRAVVLAIANTVASEPTPEETEPDA